MKKVLLGIVGVFVVVIGGGVLFLVAKSPAQRPPSSEKIEATPARLKRGEYLVEHVAACTHCHSEPNADRFGIPPKPGSKGAGGLCLTPGQGFPGHMCTPNITADAEFGVGAWTDGEIVRAMREGVSRTGTALFEMMPFKNYRDMSDEDAKSVVVYVRGLAAVAKSAGPRALKPPLNLLVKFAPKPLDGPVPEPDRSNKIAYGKYLAGMATCDVCHTPVDGKHQPIPGKAFAGGQEFKFPWGGSVKSPNITPHATGLGDRTKENFIAMFKAYDNPEAHDIPVKPEENTVMPWLRLAALTEEDLGAIYDYLRTVPPVENLVEKRPRTIPPKPPAPVAAAPSAGTASAGTPSAAAPSAGAPSPVAGAPSPAAASDSPPSAGTPAVHQPAAAAQVPGSPPAEKSPAAHRGPPEPRLQE